MNTPPRLVKRVIEQHALNVISAHDTRDTCKLFYREGTTDEICNDLDDLVKDLTGPFLVKAWRRVPKQSGRRPDSASTYTWTVVGLGVRNTAGNDAPAPVAGVPPDIVNELAELRAERMLRAAQDQDDDQDDDQEDDQDDGPLGRLVDILAKAMDAKAAAPAPAVNGTQRGHPSALTKERMAAVLQAIRNCHEQDPATFDQYEAVLLSTYGKAG